MLVDDVPMVVDDVPMVVDVVPMVVDVDPVEDAAGLDGFAVLVEPHAAASRAVLTSATATRVVRMFTSWSPRTTSRAGRAFTGRRRSALGRGVDPACRHAAFDGEPVGQATR